MDPLRTYEDVTAACAAIADLCSHLAALTSHFAGDVFVWQPRKRAVVPRPLSGDMAVIDPSAGAIEQTVEMGKQPLICVVTSAGRVIARDWKTGDWLEGTIDPGSRVS